MAYLLITFLQTQLLLYLVGISINPEVLLTDRSPGWNLFAAAMTTNQDLRSQLISKVHNRASLNTSANVFPVNYGSADGSTLQGAAR